MTELLAEKWQMPRRNVGCTTSLPMLQHRTYTFIKSVIMELSKTTILRSWETQNVIISTACSFTACTFYPDCNH